MIHIFARQQKIQVTMQQLHLCRKRYHLQMVQRKVWTKESKTEKMKEPMRGWTSHWATLLRHRGLKIRREMGRQMGQMMAAKTHLEQRAPL
jgi:hypothetical protein